MTFLFTAPGWAAGYGPPVVGSTGQFLLKDLGLLAGARLLLAKPAPELDTVTLGGGAGRRPSR